MARGRMSGHILFDYQQTEGPHFLKVNLETRKFSQLEPVPIKHRRLDSNFTNLLKRHKSELPRILAELQKSGRKVSCWAWWVFPTTKPGFCEPNP